VFTETGELDQQSFFEKDLAKWTGGATEAQTILANGGVIHTFATGTDSKPALFVSPMDGMTLCSFHDLEEIVHDWQMGELAVNEDNDVYLIPGPQFDQGQW